MSDLQSIEFWLVALMVTICIVGGFGLFARWCTLSPAVRPDQMEKLCAGMTSAEVVAILGQPRETKWTPDRTQTWVYGAPMKRHVLVLEFSAQDRMLGFTHSAPALGGRRRGPSFPEHEA
jgi:hypothetical protein